MAKHSTCTGDCISGAACPHDRLRATAKPSETIRRIATSHCKLAAVAVKFVFHGSAAVKEASDSKGVIGVNWALNKKLVRHARRREAI